MTPVYQNGQITYNIKFSRQAGWDMADVTFKIPLPEGTRFLEASAQATTGATFDGVEVTFLTPVLHRPISTASFVVEITDPARTTFTTHAWITWQGSRPGDYLTEDVSFDISKQSLNWERPRSRLQLETSATVADDVITYAIYPKNVGGSGRRMWDLKINIPVPKGTTFLSAETVHPFDTSFDGREVSFFALELERQADVGPLRFKVSTAGVAAPFTVTHAWATWKNVGRRVIRRVTPREDIRGGDIVVQPHAAQQVVADTIGDTPFSNYDLTSIALQEEGKALKITFYSVGELGVVGEPLEYLVYIDSDCRIDTGGERGNRGAEYWVRYRHERGEAHIYTWSQEQDGWSNRQPLETYSPAGGKTVSVWVPYDLFDNHQQFCWLGRSRNRTETFDSSLPSDWVGRNPRTTQYTAIPVTANRDTAASFAAPSIAAANEMDDYTLQNELETAFTPPPLPSESSIGGKLAVPLDNGWGQYNVHVFSLPEGGELTKISNARQPNFRFDGQRLLVNREGDNNATNIYEYNFADETQKEVSDAALDSHPFYEPWGRRVVYDNPLTVGADGTRYFYVLVQCGLSPPHLEADRRCRDLPWLGVLMPAGQTGEIHGSHPLWTANNMIAYRGCNTWAGSARCGIYIVDSASTKRFGDGSIPTQLTHDTSDIPTDTKGNLIAFTSRMEGNWEVYVMGLNGDGVKNLSNSPNSIDGLPTISPGGNWVAFISNRGGRWAVWVAPIAGGSTQKLFDLPNTPWGDHERNWANERISWGP